MRLAVARMCAIEHECLAPCVEPDEAFHYEGRMTQLHKYKDHSAGCVRLLVGEEMRCQSVRDRRPQRPSDIFLPP